MLLFEFLCISRLTSSEYVQYFQFDKYGNMYVFEPGAGISGECVRVKPGYEVNVTQNWFSSVQNLDHVPSNAIDYNDYLMQSDVVLSCPEPIQFKTESTKG